MLTHTNNIFRFSSILASLSNLVVNLINNTHTAKSWLNNGLGHTWFLCRSSFVVCEMFGHTRLGVLVDSGTWYIVVYVGADFLLSFG